MTGELYPAVTRDLTHMRRELAPEAAAAFNEFGKVVFADGALSAKVKNIIAVAAAHVTQCHQELMEAIWVAAEMRAGAAFAHSIIAIAEMAEVGASEANDHPHHALATGERHDHST
jgi:alkylhydroperoxidase/carboxymuconolactone decarboxylase family protein YurZ